MGKYLVIGIIIFIVMIPVAFIAADLTLTANSLSAEDGIVVGLITADVSDDLSEMEISIPVKTETDGFLPKKVAADIEIEGQGSPIMFALEFDLATEKVLKKTLKLPQQDTAWLSTNGSLSYSIIWAKVQIKIFEIALPIEKDIKIDSFTVTSS